MTKEAQIEGNNSNKQKSKYIIIAHVDNEAAEEKEEEKEIVGPLRSKRTVRHRQVHQITHLTTPVLKLRQVVSVLLLKSLLMISRAAYCRKNSIGRGGC